MINVPTTGAQNLVLPQMEENLISKIGNHLEAGKNKTNEELLSLSHQFESIFLHQLLKSMRSTIQKSEFLNSHATRMYESMHDQELANLMSEKRSIGLAGMVYKDLVRMEKASKSQSIDSGPVLDSNI